jgi:hypothetical protein
VKGSFVASIGVAARKSNLIAKASPMMRQLEIERRFDNGISVEIEYVFFNLKNLSLWGIQAISRGLRLIQSQNHQED